jgi:membrane glycosyltransferase
MARNSTTRTGWILLGSSFLIAVAPIVLALVLIPLTCGGFSGANEGNCGAAALPWFLFFTVPAGFISAIAGIVTLAIGYSKKPTVAPQAATAVQSEPTNEEAPPQ